jgi:hypothetical protein
LNSRSSLALISLLQALTLVVPAQGSEYVECFKSWKPYTCHIRIKKHAVSPGEAPGSNFFVFGDFFLRKYYTIFDHESKKMAFACSSQVPGCKVPSAL